MLGKTLPKFGGIRHHEDISSGAIGAPTLGNQNVSAGLPRNPFNAGEAAQAEPLTEVAQNPIAQTPIPQNRIGKFQ